MPHDERTLIESRPDSVNPDRVEAYLRRKWLVAPGASCLAGWGAVHHSDARVHAGEDVGMAAALPASAELVQVGFHWAVGVTAAIAADDLHPKPEHLSGGPAQCPLILKAPRQKAGGCEQEN